MKAILTIEMPRNCARCPLADEHPIPFSQEVLFECKVKKRMADGVKAYGKRAIGKRPEWCPLRDMAYINQVLKKGVHDEEFVDGWNACLDEIEGRAE